MSWKFHIEYWYYIHTVHNLHTLYIYIYTLFLFVTYIYIYTQYIFLFQKTCPLWSKFRWHNLKQTLRRGRDKTPKTQWWRWESPSRTLNGMSLGWISSHVAGKSMVAQGCQVRHIHSYTSCGMYVTCGHFGGPSRHIYLEYLEFLKEERFSEKKIQKRECLFF